MIAVLITCLVAVEKKITDKNNSEERSIFWLPVYHSREVTVAEAWGGQVTMHPQLGGKQ